MISSLNSGDVGWSLHDVTESVMNSVAAIIIFKTYTFIVLGPYM